MTRQTTFVLLTVLTVLTASIGCKTSEQLIQTPPSAKPVELALLMKNIQYFAHKLGLTLQAQNRPLATFYAHELEEGLQDIYALERHDTLPIGQIAQKIMPLPLSALAEAIENAEHDPIPAYRKFLNACNQCHDATQHGFIRIIAPSNNPFNQSFEVPAQ
jgi:hypothetical protein